MDAGNREGSGVKEKRTKGKLYMVSWYKEPLTITLVLVKPMIFGCFYLN